jgi:hypothetical protein
LIKEDRVLCNNVFFVVRQLGKDRVGQFVFKVENALIDADDLGGFPVDLVKFPHGIGVYSAHYEKYGKEAYCQSSKDCQSHPDRPPPGRGLWLHIWDGLLNLYKKYHIFHVRATLLWDQKRVQKVIEKIYRAL